MTVLISVLKSHWEDWD